jgi:polyhydroxyalkanoate synthesis regulator phasin
MPKAEVVGRAPRRRARRRPAELPNAVEGQIAEICRDLAVQAKRMRQLHEQADELRRVIRQWAGQSEADLPRTSQS